MLCNFDLLQFLFMELLWRWGLFLDTHLLNQRLLVNFHTLDLQWLRLYKVHRIVHILWGRNCANFILEFFLLLFFRLLLPLQMISQRLWLKTVTNFFLFLLVRFWTRSINIFLLDALHRLTDWLLDVIQSLDRVLVLLGESFHSLCDLVDDFEQIWHSFIVQDCFWEFRVLCALVPLEEALDCRLRILACLRVQSTHDFRDLVQHADR